MKGTSAEEAILGGGCFWCTEAIFTELKGVESVESGYSGGSTINPSYKDICTGETGHAEVVKIIFNPDVLKFSELLEVFFLTHDPTTLNQQGADRGTQYRSVVFYSTIAQKEMAENVIAKLNEQNVYRNKIVTEVSPLSNFYPAENYHQDYFKNNENQPYCRMVIQPKMEKFRKVFENSLKK